MLPEQYGEEGAPNYAIMRYLASINPASDKGEAAWLHDRFTAKPTNITYPSWNVSSFEKVRVIGEFIGVIQNGVECSSGAVDA